MTNEPDPFDDVVLVTESTPDRYLYPRVVRGASDRVITYYAGTVGGEATLVEATYTLAGADSAQRAISAFFASQSSFLNAATFGIPRQQIWPLLA